MSDPNQPNKPPIDIDDEGPATGVAVKSRTKTKKPAMYKVLLLNDDYTPMEFVVHVLEQFFEKASEEAVQIMLHVHQKGVGICGVFTYEVAGPRSTMSWIFPGSTSTRCNVRSKRTVAATTRAGSGKQRRTTTCCHATSSRRSIGP